MRMLARPRLPGLQHRRLEAAPQKPLWGQEAYKWVRRQTVLAMATNSVASSSHRHPVLMSRLCPDPKCKAIPCKDDDSCADVESQASHQTALPAPDKGYAKYAPCHT